MPERTDEDIAAHIQEGDTESFGLLVNRYEEKMKRYARKFLFDGEEAKDVVQEVFIKAYINIKSFQIHRKFSSWLYRIAHNELINAVKKKKRTPILFIDLDVLLPHLSSRPAGEEEMEKKEIKQLLEQSLEKIDVKYREPLVLYYFEEFDYKEIADILQIPVSTVGVRIRRGKAVLKKVINIEKHV